MFAAYQSMNHYFESKAFVSFIIIYIIIFNIFNIILFYLIYILLIIVRKLTKYFTTYLYDRGCVNGW